LTCPLCGRRKARRACPALGRQICTVCCATKRLGEIHCPDDCTYLAVAREHPPAAEVRQQQRDLAVVVRTVRDFTERQSELFLLAGTFLSRYPSPDFQPLVDDDVAEATAALAATFETSSRGLIFDHRPASLPADRLRAALSPVLVEAGRNGGTAFDRDAAVVLRRFEEAVREMRGIDPQNRRAFLDLLGRVIKRSEESRESEAPRDAPRLIIP
jgi:hypothetical protein